MMRRQSCLCGLTTLILAMLSSTVHSSQAQSSPHLNSTHLEWSVPSATPAGRARVIITKTKAKVSQARQHRPLVLLKLNDDDTDYYDEPPDLQVGYRRPELVNQTANINDDLSDEIKIRLILARKKALAVYHANWS